MSATVTNCVTVFMQEGSVDLWKVCEKREDILLSLVKLKCTYGKTDRTGDKQTEY